jgi:acetoacetyl-CoA synthetase
VTEQPIWTPSPERRAAARLTAFLALANQRFDARAADYDGLWRWSIDRPEAFWRAVSASERIELALFSLSTESAA